MSLPIVFFFVGWLHWYFSLPASLIFLAGVYSFVKKLPTEKKIDSLSTTNECAIAVIIVLLYLLATGHGTLLGGAGYDTPWRNVVYQDLIHKSWPVIYGTSHSALVYYLAYWLVPAMLAHVLNLGVTASNIVLVLWTYIGLRLFIFLTWDYLQANKKQIIPLTILFLLWSGLNFIGMLVVCSLDLMPFVVDNQWGWQTWWYTGITNDGHQIAYMVRTVFDSLGNIYNQFVPLLLGTILFLRQRALKSLGFLGLLVLPYSPLGFIGLFCLMLPEAFRQVKNYILSDQSSLLKNEIFSIPNLSVLLSVFPVFFFYFLVNSATEATVGTGNVFFAPLSSYGFLRISLLVLYYLLQFGIYMWLCFRHNRDRLLFWSVLLSLFVFPFFRVGGSGDFCWNASIPGFMIVMIFVMQEVLLLFKEGRASIHFFMVAVVLTITIITPCLQMSSQIRKCFEFQKHVVNIDHPRIGTTLDNKDTNTIIKDFPNLANVNYQNSLFYKYLAKEAKEKK